MWRGDEPIPGGAAAIAQLRAAGCLVGFMSNNSSVPVAEVAAKLGRFGIDVPHEHVLTSALAAADLLSVDARPGLPGPHVRRARRRRGAHRRGLRTGPGGSGRRGGGRLSSRLRLRRARARVRRPSAPVPASWRPTSTPRTRWPAAGSSRARARSWPRSPPRPGAPPKSRASRPRRRPTWSTTASGSRGVMVGDRPTTDGALADRLGWPFALVLSGVAQAGTRTRVRSRSRIRRRRSSPTTSWRSYPASLRRWCPHNLARRTVSPAGHRLRRREGWSGGREAPARRRAGPARPRRVPHRGGSPDRRRPGRSRRDAGHHVGSRGSRRVPRSWSSATVPSTFRRGGTKLAGALDAFARPSRADWCSRRRRVHGRLHRLRAPARRRGSSTRSTSAAGQLAWRIRQDPRVVIYERTNVRTLDPAVLGTRSISSSPTSPSSRCGRWRRRSSPARRRPPTSCSS